MTDDNKFWRDTEHAEEQFTGNPDVTWFRKRMLRLGHEPSVIRERIADMHPLLVGQFDRLERKQKPLSEEMAEVLRRLCAGRVYPAPNSSDISRVRGLGARRLAVPGNHAGSGWTATEAGHLALAAYDAGDQ